MRTLIASSPHSPPRPGLNFDISNDGPKVLAAERRELDQWMEQAFKLRLREYGTKLLCYSPTAYPYEIPDHKQRSPDNFVSLSVTGTACSLRCEHCDGRLLKGMEPTLSPESLYDRCRQVAEAGGEGVLISGGSDSEGHVPLSRFAKAIRRVKEDFQLAVAIHTGLVDEETATLLADARVDAAMLDIIGNKSVAEKVYHIRDAPKKMLRSLQILEGCGIPTVPHILVGLDYGRLKGELEALDMVSRGNPSALVIIALNPIRNTPMEGITPPSPQDIGRITAVARLGMKKLPILLGCARPMGAHKIKTDECTILSGVNGIAMISQDGADFARAKGLEPVFRDVCCSLAYQALA